jgi:hypothetical protein
LCSLTNKSKLTCNILKHSFVTQANNEKRSTPMLQLAADIASKNSLSSVAAFNCFSEKVADPLDRNPNLMLARPRTATAQRTNTPLVPLKKRLFLYFLL